MKKRYPDKSNVLLVNITRLGDMLQATPTIAGIKMENPSCRITVLVEKQFEDVCRSIPEVDEVVSLDLSMTVRSLAREQAGIIEAYEYVSEFVEDLKRRNFDYCLNMSSSAYTALLLKLIGVKQSGGWSSDEEGYRVIESDWAKLFATSVFHQNRQFNSLNLVDIFRCSADVEKHPRHLLIGLDRQALDYSGGLVAQAGFTNGGPLIAVQAGASQNKRQWEREKFVKLIEILVKEHQARIVLTGSKKELSIIEPIKSACDSCNVFVAAGKTNIAQLAALLQLSEILITGDTGPMHMSVAVGTPVIAMFLASAYGFETGPYSEGNIVLQPIIGCGPCNPNKSCAKTDCHDHFEPALVARLVMMRLKEDFRQLPKGLVDSNKLIVYRSYFDQQGFCDLEALNGEAVDPYTRYRQAYRKLWLDDLGGYEQALPTAKKFGLKVYNQACPGIASVVEMAEEGLRLISGLIELVDDNTSAPAELGKINYGLSELDRRIEQIGFHYAYLGPLTRMFIFAKENLCGTEAASLASQMGRIYEDLVRRAKKFSSYLSIS